LLAVVVAKGEPPVKSGASATADVAATIGGEVISLRELDERVLKTNMKLAKSLYDARRTALDEVILEKALASEASAGGMTVDQLVRKRVADKIAPVTNTDIEAYFNANKARLRGRTLEQTTGQIRSMLVSQRKSAAKKSLLAEVKKNTIVKIKLDAPRAQVAVAANEPSRGPATAKVTIVEFSDFQ